MKYCPDDAVLLHLLRILNITEPMGTWNRKLWIPDPLYEERTCCAGYSRDTRAPLRVIDHCRMINHVCAILGVDLKLANETLEEKHWRILRRLLSLGHQETPLIDPWTNPTVQDCAPIIVQYARRFAHQFSTDELKMVARWISPYYHEAANIDWDAIWTINQLQER
jgi:hypothetical protein